MSASSDNAATPAAAAPPWSLAWRLALGQIVSWGILYYTFTVVAGPMHASTGWSRTFLNLGLSLGLLAWGACAYPVGWWIQRRGARELMTLSSLLGGAALALMGLATAPGVYLAAWILLGAAMAGTLYDPAFAVVTTAFGQNYRRGITLITLVGGLASTVFIPLTQLAVDSFGWRTALLLLALAQVLLCVPLHAWSIPPKTQGARPEAAGIATRFTAWWETFRADVSDPRFIGLALWFAAHSAAFTGLIFLLVPMLQSWNVPSETIVVAIAVMGPSQVAGRLFLSLRGAHFASLRVGAFAMATLLGAALVLLLLPPTRAWLCVFTAALGLGNGMLTIVRGTAVAELFGLARYAEINGALAAPGVLAKAAAPLVLASAWTHAGSARAVPLLSAAALAIGIGGLFYVRNAQRRHASLPQSAANAVTET